MWELAPYTLNPKGICRLQGARKVAAQNKSTLASLRNSFLRGQVIGIDTGSVALFCPKAKLCRIQSAAHVDLGFAMSHQHDLQRWSPET